MDEVSRDLFPSPTVYLRWSRPVGRNRTLQQLHKRKWWDWRKPRSVWKDVPLLRIIPAEVVEPVPAD